MSQQTLNASTTNFADKQEGTTNEATRNADASNQAPATAELQTKISNEAERVVPQIQNMIETTAGLKDQCIADMQVNLNAEPAAAVAEAVTALNMATVSIASSLKCITDRTKLATDEDNNSLFNEIKSYLAELIEFIDKMNIKAQPSGTAFSNNELKAEENELTKVAERNENAAAKSVDDITKPTATAEPEAAITEQKETAEATDESEMQPTFSNNKNADICKEPAATDNESVQNRIVDEWLREHIETTMQALTEQQDALTAQQPATQTIDKQSTNIADALESNAEPVEQMETAAATETLVTAPKIDLAMHTKCRRNSIDVKVKQAVETSDDETTNVKKIKLEELPERKSIIEVCLNSDVKSEALAEVKIEQLSPKKEIKKESTLLKQVLKRETKKDIARKMRTSHNVKRKSSQESDSKRMKIDAKSDAANNDDDDAASEDEADLPPEALNEDEQARDEQMRALGKSFLQHLPCFKLPLSENVSKCRECSRRKQYLKQQQQSQQAQPVPDSNAAANSTADGATLAAATEAVTAAATASTTPQSIDVYCRFYEFRRMQYNAEGVLTVAGWPNPYTDATAADLNIWRPERDSQPTAQNLDIQTCRYILLHVGDQFCYLWRQEVDALKLHENGKKGIAWKKLVQGVREICDVCDTTLFNYHWTCEKCGFSVCMECVRDRKESRVSAKTRANDKQRRVDEYHWLLCAKREKHEIRQLMLTQIIAGNALHVLGQLMHDVRQIWQVPQLCRCLLSKQRLERPPEFDQYVKNIITEQCLKIEADIAGKPKVKPETNQEAAMQPPPTFKENRLKKLREAMNRAKLKRNTDDETSLGKDPIATAFDDLNHINFHRKGLAGWRRFIPPRSMTLSQSSKMAPGVPHEWLCGGQLLRLTDAANAHNNVLFQEVWKCGQPVMISDVARTLNLSLWHPKAFCADFGDKNNDLINCLTGNLVPNQPMRHFWEGFECINKRLLDSHGRPMLLKLKDWPPGDDFAELLPTRYSDLMKGLPLPEYTLRTGHFNIASCLPEMFVPPDLGPKMYNAYGSALHPDRGTTNLHLDISDAVNIMVYVGIPQDVDSKPQLTATQRAISLGGCDFLTRARLQDPAELPGALWHIFPARDADKIRDLLNRVTIERGFRLEPDHDPIHDQNWYLDDKLRQRLFKDYGVEGFPIVQCQGDAVFIPAGAPHQVQNLHNCIKVAEDFVSPENITHCYHLTHEFRRLSHSHTNHEDKLQIKNIIYHAIKDCCIVLYSALDQRLDAEIAEVEAVIKLQKAAKKT